MKTVSLFQWVQFLYKSSNGDFRPVAAPARDPIAQTIGGATLSRRAGLRRRLVLYRIDELERQIEAEFGVEALAPMLAELASLQAELR